MVKLVIILILIAIELSLAVPKQQKFAYPLITTDEEENSNNDNDADYIGQEIYKLMDDMIPPSLIDKRKDIPIDPCSCPYKTRYFPINNLTTTIYLEGRICDAKAIENRKHNSFCQYGTCKESNYKIIFFENDKKITMQIPLDCRCLN